MSHRDLRPPAGRPEPAKGASTGPPPGGLRPVGGARLIDARGASQLLGVPYTWLLAQARAWRIPHHRLGHYVRFDPQELAAWLRETRIAPHTITRRER
jgi:hypothetical protein